jgi:DNA-binding winged helix-turn-helix (wHTH) protein
MTNRHNPFVLGKPIKDPDDFYGRTDELRELFESVINIQPVALVGEHRCGNTSILFQMMHPEVQCRHLDPADVEGLVFAFFNSQLAADGPDTFYRRVARAIKKADPDADIDLEDDIDPFWIEDYLEDLTGRDKRLVILMDEFEVLAGFKSSFWEWYRGLIIQYDVSIVVASRVEVGEFRDDWGTGSPFFNMFRSIYVGSFTPREVDDFLTRTAEIAEVDFTPVRSAIDQLAGRFPYYLQVAAALFFDLSAREALTGSAEQIAAAAQEFTTRNEPHFEDIWHKLPAAERDALAWLAVGATPDPREALGFNQARPILERRGYIIDGRIFSTAFADFVRRQIPRIELKTDTGEVRIEKRPLDLPPKEFALLRFFLAKPGEVVSKDDIATAVWPEYAMDTMGVTDAMIQKTISRLRKEVDASGTSFQHIESIRGQGYRFQNASVYEFYHHAGTPDGNVGGEE